MSLQRVEDVAPKHRARRPRRRGVGGDNLLRRGERRVVAERLRGHEFELGRGGRDGGCEVLGRRTGDANGRGRRRALSGGPTEFPVEEPGAPREGAGGKGGG